MLSQHLITKPIFDALFENYDLAKNNDVARVMQKMIDTLDAHSLDKETEKLEGFYANVRLRVEGIDNATGKQRVITELYEHFFSKASTCFIQRDMLAYFIFWNWYFSPCLIETWHSLKCFSSSSR